jgi:hypothetical protein
MALGCNCAVVLAVQVLPQAAAAAAAGAAASGGGTMSKV